jgi:hypothetical protein
MLTNGGFQTASSSLADAYKNAGAPVNGVDEVQRLTSTATGGTFDYTWTNPLTGVAATLLAVAFNISAAALQALIRAMANYPTNGVITCTGGALNAAPIDITYTGDMSGLDVAPATVNNASATGGTVVVSTPTPGVQGTQRGAQKGSLLSDTTNAILYQNGGTANKPSWGKVGTQS